MAKIVVELTNRCNLNCHHCFSGRHGGKDDLPIAVLENIWTHAKNEGFDLLSFTGGDPTLHKSFALILDRTVESGYQFGVNTNGINFPKIYPLIQKHQSHCKLITFSMDGASEATHDKLRGKNAYRRLMQAISVCVFEKIPFALNMVLAAHNAHEISQAAKMAAASGAQGIRFCHLMPSPITTDMELDLSPWEKKRLDAEVAQLRHEQDVRIEMAPGDHTTDPLPCAPLHLEEINVDCHGNLTTCCHLSGHGPGTGNDDRIGNLITADFPELFALLKLENKRFIEAKKAHFASEQLSDTDFFSCWYCTNHYKKIDWLKKYNNHSWVEHIWNVPDDRARVIPIAVAHATEQSD